MDLTEKHLITWKDIEALKWNECSKKRKGYEEVQQMLKLNFTEETIDRMRDFVKTKENKLRAVMSKFWKKNPQYQSCIGSDDGYWDVLVHVIGLGEAEFNKALKDPMELENRYKKRDYEESFLYCFQI